MTAIDVFSRYLFAYPLTEATASNTAKVLIDIMTKHSYLPTTIITDKGTAFTSKIIAEITQVLGITVKCATTKHPQTIGRLERKHTSLKTNFKMASGEYRRQWHKYLPLAVLNYNTTYHSSIGCEPSKVFHERIPYNVLDHKLGNNPNKDFLPTTEFALELQKRTQILIDQTKKNIMQSYLKYKEYYDRKAKAAPLNKKDFNFIMQPKADNQGLKIPFRDYRWIGPYIIENVLPNDSYIVRRLNTNKTQVLHRIRLKKFVPNTPLVDRYSKDKLQPEEEIVVPQDDLYTISWEADFDYEIFEPTQDAVPHGTTQRDAAQASDATENDVTERRPLIDESPYAAENENDVTEKDECRATNSDAEKPSRADSPNGPNAANSPPNSENNDNDGLNENEEDTNVSNRGGDITVPGKSEDEKANENSDEHASPRGGKYNLRPNHNPNFTDEYKY